MAQFRVEFVLDQAAGKYLAELYNPDNQQELMVRTEALYPSQAAAVLGLVQLFKDAILQFPQPGEPVRKIGKPEEEGQGRQESEEARQGQAGQARQEAQVNRLLGGDSNGFRTRPRRGGPARRASALPRISTTRSRSTRPSPARRRAAIRAPWSRA